MKIPVNKDDPRNGPAGDEAQPPLADEYGDSGTDVKSVDPEQVVAHEAKLTELASEVEQWKTKYQRAIADYQNLSRRSLENEREAKVQATKSVVQSFVPVLDHFDLALAQDTSKATSEQVKQGLAVIREEMVKVLGLNNVTIIRPAPGDVFDPMKHEALMQAVAEGMEPNHVVQCFQNGYAIGERTLRPAKVSVSA